MSKDKQIEEMAFFIFENSPLTNLSSEDLAKDLYNAGYRKQSEGEWLPTCDNHPLVNKYKCSCCGEKNLRGNFCPNCGAHMKGGAK